MSTPEKKYDIQGHRGARGLAPENTIAAFRKALECGVTTLEMDVVITADEQVLVSHEPWMSAAICKTPDGKSIAPGEDLMHNIFRMKAERAQMYDCGTTPTPDFPFQKLHKSSKPLLHEVLEEFEDEPVDFNIEIKSDPKMQFTVMGAFQPQPVRMSELTVSVIREAGLEKRCIIQSFDPEALNAAHRLAPEMRFALLVENGDSPESNLALLDFQPDIYSPDFALLTTEVIGWLHGKGILVIPWTVNEPADMSRMIGMGVDGIITDYPNRIRRDGTLTGLKP